MTSHMDHHPSLVVQPLLKNKSQALRIIVDVSLDPLSGGGHHKKSKKHSKKKSHGKSH